MINLFSYNGLPPKEQATYKLATLVLILSFIYYTLIAIIICVGNLDNPVILPLLTGISGGLIPIDTIIVQFFFRKKEADNIESKKGDK